MGVVVIVWWSGGKLQCAQSGGSASPRIPSFPSFTLETTAWNGITGPRSAEPFELGAPACPETSQCTVLWVMSFWKWEEW